MYDIGWKASLAPLVGTRKCCPGGVVRTGCVSVVQSDRAAFLFRTQTSLVSSESPGWPPRWLSAAVSGRHGNHSGHPSGHPCLMRPRSRLAQWPPFSDRFFCCYKQTNNLSEKGAHWAKRERGRKRQGCPLGCPCCLDTTAPEKGRKDRRTEKKNGASESASFGAR